MPSIHWISVIAAALSAFLLGGIWYSPIAFFHPWKNSAQLTDAQLRQRSPLRVFGGALLLINGGYHTLQFTLYGLILGLWH